MFYRLLLCLSQASLAAGRTVLRSFFCYRTCERTSEPTLMPIGSSGPLGEAVKQSGSGSGGQRSRSHEAKDRFGGLAEALFFAPLVSSVFCYCVCVCVCMCVCVRGIYYVGESVE